MNTELAHSETEREPIYLQRERFRIYGEGLCYASVCSSLPLEEVAARMMSHETGISSQWHFSDEREFSSGQSNPCPCTAWPDTHTHYLFVC